MMRHLFHVRTLMFPAKYLQQRIHIRDGLACQHKQSLMDAWMVTSRDRLHVNLRSKLSIGASPPVIIDAVSFFNASCTFGYFCSSDHAAPAFSTPSVRSSPVRQHLIVKEDIKGKLDAKGFDK